MSSALYGRWRGRSYNLYSGLCSIATRKNMDNVFFEGLKEEHFVDERLYEVKA